MLNELQDDELRTVIEQSQSLLKQRDEERKAKAIERGACYACRGGTDA